MALRGDVPLADRIDPAVRCLVESNALKSKVVLVGVPIDGVEDPECFFREILGCRNARQDDCLVVWQAVQEIHNRCVTRKNKEGMIPDVDQMAMRKRLDLGEVHHHAVRGIAGLRNDVTGKGYLDCVAMPVQMSALAAMVRDSMTCVKLEAAGNLHVRILATIV